MQPDSLPSPCAREPEGTALIARCAAACHAGCIRRARRSRPLRRRAGCRPEATGIIRRGILQLSFRIPVMPIHAFTSITCNYLPKARVLAESLKTFHPEIVLHLVLVDTPPFWLQMEDERFDSLLRLGDLVLRNPEQWVFQHSVVEAGTGIKGFALEKLLRRPDCSGVLYFDPDIVLFSRLDGLLAELDRASVLVTPHLTEPETTLEGIKDNEFAALQHGIYNLGFLGVKNTTEGRRFAAWWKHRLEHFCFDDIPRGIFTDQRWVDLAPAYFKDIRILRDPEYNVCTWNLTSRKID